MNIRFYSLLGALLVCVQSFALTPDNEALKKLMRALESQRDVESTLIQDRSMDGVRIRVKTQTIPYSGIRASTVSPAFYSGIVSFDDGVTYRLYDPHKNTVIFEKSPNRYAFDIAFRKGLIQKNYAVRFEEDATVAQRKVRVIFLEGLKNGIADRKLFIDEASDLILRYEVMRKGAGTDVRINTLKVQLGVDYSADFSKIAPRGAKVVKPVPPIEIGSASGAGSYVSFEPVVPETLIAGLETQALHIVHHKDSKFVAVRLTDGMAFVTVYLYPSKVKRSTGELVSIPVDTLPLDGKSIAEALDGLRCWIIGDADELIKERLARLFIRAYDRTID